MKNPFGIDQAPGGSLPEAEKNNSKENPSGGTPSAANSAPEKNSGKHSYYSSFVKFSRSGQEKSEDANPAAGHLDDDEEKEIAEIAGQRFGEEKKMDAHVPTLDEIKFASAPRASSQAGAAPQQNGAAPFSRIESVSSPPSGAGKKSISTNEKKAIISGLNAKDTVQADEMNFFKRNFTLLIKLAILFLLSAVILAAGVFGFEQYEKYYKEITLEKILPAGANITVRITIDPQSRQFQYLEENMGKFPGYAILKKKIDKVGQGKTVSQIFQENLNDLNLDFQEDIKPLLGSDAYIIIPDLGPLGEKLQNQVLLSQNGAKYFWEKIKNGISPSAQELAAGGEPNNSTAVLGEEINRLAQGFYPLAGDEGKAEKKLDFITASNIKDLKKAREALDKMKKDGKYEISQLRYKGFSYFKAKAKESAGQNPESEPFKFEETYHAILGKNWVVASREEDIKNIISRTKENLTISGMLSKNSQSSLSDDGDWKKVIENINKAGEESLVTAYYNINFKELFGKKECAGEADCEDISRYLKLPEKRIGGFLLKADPKGFAMRSTANDIGENLNAKSLKEGLAKKIPQKINDRWTDVFWEHSGFKNAYYNFKKNNLTDKGLESLNNILAAVKAELGIDLETDFIDQIEGNIALSLFANKGLEPQEAFVAEIKDGEKMINSMKKIVELVKASSAKIYAGGEMSALQQPLAPQQQSIAAEAEKKNKEMYDKIIQSQITEAATPDGKIYSYKLPVPDLTFAGGLSFDFSVENNIFILGSHYAAVESLLREIKNNAEGRLADNEFYKRGVPYSLPDRYINTFFYTEGIWDAIDYYMNDVGKKADEARAKAWQASLEARNEYCDGLADKSKDSICATPPPAPPSNTSKSYEEEEKFAVRSIFQTIKVANFSKALKDGFAKSFIFVNIEEIPKEEKDRAEKILEGM
jgi:hypothetical protein